MQNHEFSNSRSRTARSSTHFRDKDRAMRHTTKGTLVFLQLLVGIAMLAASSSPAQVAIANADAARRAPALLKQMNIAEKIVQVNQAARVSFGGILTASPSLGS